MKCDQHKMAWTCEVSGCTRPANSGAICVGHRYRLRKFGSYGSTPLLPNSRKPKVCTAEECVSPVRSHGLCNAHYHRLLKYGSAAGGRSQGVERGCSMLGCDRRHQARGLCAVHYGTVVRRADKQRRPPASKSVPSSKQVAWLKAILAVETDHCVAWPFSAGDGRYGKVTFQGRRLGAHRLSCLLAHGEPSAPELQAAHICGNTACCNPRHLRWATNQENAADKIIHRTMGKGVFGPAPTQITA